MSMIRTEDLQLRSEDFPARLRILQGPEEREIANRLLLNHHDLSFIPYVSQPQTFLAVLETATGETYTLSLRLN